MILTPMLWLVKLTTKLVVSKKAEQEFTRGPRPEKMQLTADRLNFEFTQ